MLTLHLQVNLLLSQISNELHRQIIKKIKRRKVYSSFRDNICGVDLADMQSLSKYNKGIKYLLCAIDLFSKYAWVVPLKDKRGISIVNAFQKIISEGRKANKILLLKDLLGCWKARFFKHMKAVSKNVYFDVLDDIVNKYNNTVHRTIKIKPIDVTSDSYAEYNEGSNEKDMKAESQNMKTFLLKDTPRIGQKNILSLVKLNI